MAEPDGSFSVRYAGTTTGANTTETFTHVIHATGLMSNKPYVPEFPGTEKFSGNLLHSSERRNDETEFSGKSVVIVGNGKSAQDAALAAVDAGALRVTQLVRQGHWTAPRRFFGLIPCAPGSH